MLHEWWKTADDDTLWCVVDGVALWAAESMEEVYAAGLAPVRVVAPALLAAALQSGDEEE